MTPNSAYSEGKRDVVVKHCFYIYTDVIENHNSEKASILEACATEF